MKGTVHVRNSNLVEVEDSDGRIIARASRKNPSCNWNFGKTNGTSVQIFPMGQIFNMPSEQLQRKLILAIMNELA